MGSDLKRGQSDRVSTVCVSRWDKEAPLEESQKATRLLYPIRLREWY